MTCHARTGFRRCGTSLPQLSSGPLGRQLTPIAKMKLHFYQLLACSAICIIVVSYDAISQPYGRVVGNVIDGRTGELLEKANIWIPSTSLGATTDRKGAYLISHVPPGVYLIRVSIIGYEPDSSNSVRVMPNAIDTVDFKLYNPGHRRALKDIAKGKVQIAVPGLVIRLIPEE